MDLAQAGQLADLLIAREVAVQDQMWGDANERADATDNQLIDAAMAQLGFLQLRFTGLDEAVALQAAEEEYYPTDLGWSGFRSYGSNIANLVVAAAYIRSEIKRRALLGEEITRTRRNEAWGEKGGTSRPYMSSEEALKNAPPDYLPPKAMGPAGH